MGLLNCNSCLGLDRGEGHPAEIRSWVPPGLPPDTRFWANPIFKPPNPPYNHPLTRKWP